MHIDHLTYLLAMFLIQNLILASFLIGTMTQFANIIS